MNWAKVFVLVLSGCLMVERHGVMGQCMTDETLSFSVLGCTAAGGVVTCTPPAGMVMGRFLFGIGTGMCMVAAAPMGVEVSMLQDGDMCLALVLTCNEVTTTTSTTTTTTTTAAPVDSPESAESGVGGASSRRR